VIPIVGSTWVKVCGITRPADAEMVAAAGADAIGINLLQRSPRRVDEATAIEIAAASPVPALVLVEHVPAGHVAVYLDRLGVDGVQPYGPEAASVAATAAEAGWLALLPTVVADVLSLPAGVVPLFDTPDPKLLGGTGRTFDWTRIDRDAGRFVLAGGLGPDNVAEAIRLTGAWGVDASSRLEAEVGVKDVGKVTEFVREAKQA
jgi:phosphoribosylanthranilate isomerase